MSEVLDRQDHATRRFLLYTSILERLSGPLCDAVLETEGSAHRLVAIERANLFLAPLDGRRVWYRYHHLFRDLLVNELHMSEAQPLDELHRRAARWHLENGFVAAAIHHAAAAGDFEETAELIAAHWLTYVQPRRATDGPRLDARTSRTASRVPTLGLAWRGRGCSCCSVVRARSRLRSERPSAASCAASRCATGQARSQSNAATIRTSAHLLLGDVGQAVRTAALAAELEPDRAGPLAPDGDQRAGNGRVLVGRQPATR